MIFGMISNVMISPVSAILISNVIIISNVFSRSKEKDTGCQDPATNQMQISIINLLALNFLSNTFSFSCNHHLNSATTDMEIQTCSQNVYGNVKNMDKMGNFQPIRKTMEIMFLIFKTVIKLTTPKSPNLNLCILILGITRPLVSR